MFKLKYISAICVIITVFVADVNGDSSTTGNDQQQSKWSAWSVCSATCGRGFRTRTRQNCNSAESTCNDQKDCFNRLCPSYLDWPRIHFSGRFVADIPTTNNVRCFYQPNGFCPTCDTNRAKTETGLFRQEGTDRPRFIFGRRSYNAMGTSHFYFYQAKVTSACWNGSSGCVTDDPIVQRAVRNPHPGRLVDLDVDWQIASEIYGFKVHIPGVFTASMKRTLITSITTRIPTIAGDMSLVGNFKGKLTNITWIDPVFKDKFQNAKELSIRFQLDLFNGSIMEGRVMGTIGMTSPDDPNMVYGAREMKPGQFPHNGSVPFYISRKYKKLVLDMSGVMDCDVKGNFNVTDKLLDVVVLPNSDQSCHSLIDHDCDKRELHCEGKNFILLTLDGGLNKTQTTQEWYTIFGGIVEIDLDWAEDDVFYLLSNSRIGIVQRTPTSNGETQRSGLSSFTSCGGSSSDTCGGESSSADSCEIFMLENPRGVNIKPTKDITHRLNYKEEWKIEAVASTYGRPLKGSKVDLKIIKIFNGLYKCEQSPIPCSPKIAFPHDMVQLSESAETDANGLAELSISVPKKPGFPRGCGLDGQIFPLGLILSFPTRNGVKSVGDGGMFQTATGDQDSQNNAKEQCNLYQAYFNVPLTLQVYGSLNESVMSKECPSLDDGVRDIFNQYAGFGPVMAKRNIIDLKDLRSVRQKLYLMNMSMFEFDFEHPNFMPVTRDLSGDKTELVRRWIECEASGRNKADEESRQNSPSQTMAEVCGTPENLKKSVGELQTLLQFGMWIELYIIPPYLTAYMSMRPNANKQVSDMLLSIAIEEMNHLAYDANVLNAIGGNPNLTDSYWLPDYPTPFPSTDEFAINPGLIMKLKKMSNSLAKEVFSEIEKPDSPDVYKIIHFIADLWKQLHGSTRYTSERQPKWARSLGLHTALKTDFTFSGDDLWKKLFDKATEMLQERDVSDAYTIGAFYTKVLLHLIQVESCVKAESPMNTIFTGDPELQLRRNSVDDLKSAIEALLDVVYQGEGGYPCLPYITDLDGNPFPDHEKTHFIKYQEIAFGRKLVALNIDEQPPRWAGVPCLTHEHCVDISAEDKVFCYVGESLSINEDTDVWPIAPVPTDIHGYLDDKKINELTLRTIYEFNMIYTNLLQCLESTMNGNPKGMSTCIARMYELLNVGKRLVKMPISSSSGFTATPTWTYILDPFQQEGEQVSHNEQADIEFC